MQRETVEEEDTLENFISDKLNLKKMILMGESGSGKTTLLKTLEKTKNA